MGKRVLSARNRTSKDKDHIDKALDTDAEIAQFARIVAQGLPYVRFARLDPPIEATEFQKIRNIAVLTEALHIPDRAVVARLGIGVETMAQLKANVHYEMIAQEVRDRVDALAGATNITGIAKASEMTLGLELLAQALSATGTREQLAALAELAARSDPKVGRPKEKTNNTLFLPQEILSALATRIQSQELSIEVEPEKVVSASTLGVPKRELSE